MILFCSAARFNESVNALGTLESVESGGLALPVSGALMFNYHKLLILIHLLLLLLTHFLTMEGKSAAAEGITTSLTESTRKSTQNAVLLLLNVPPVLCSSLTAHRSSALPVSPLFPTAAHWGAFRSPAGFDLYLAFKSGPTCV